VKILDHEAVRITCSTISSSEGPESKRDVVSTTNWVRLLNAEVSLFD
jgi:hypothetical protein